MPSRPTRGLTTQKRLSSTSMGSVSGLMRAVITAVERSSESWTRSTRPTWTLRVLISVLPASIPSALAITRVTWGPRLR